jgi:hypothetical protein
LKKSKFLFRIGVCIIIVGLSILFANLTGSLKGGTVSWNFNVVANGTYMLVAEFSNRPYEIRILVPKDFKGTFYIFNYEGIKKLTEGTKIPMIEQAVDGPQLIDFTPNRRGAYMILIKSEISTPVSGSVGTVEKEAISQDIQRDSVIFTFFGLAITSVAHMLKAGKFLRRRFF